MVTKNGFLAMKTDQYSLGSDFEALGSAAKNLANHAIQLTGIGTSFFQWLAAASAIYLLVLDRTNWKTNILTSLLIPYIFLSFPPWLFGILRGDIGKWIACVAIVLKLFIPKHFPDWLELPASGILLIVVAPSLIADTVKGGRIGIIICLAIACYLLQEHIRASGGFRNSFTKSNGVSNSVGIILLLVYPVWAIIFHLL